MTEEEEIAMANGDENVTQTWLGRKLGKEWAGQFHAYHDLAKFVARVNEAGGSDQFVGVANNGNNRGSAIAVHAALFGDESPTAEEVNDFWEDVVGLGDDWEKEANSTAFASGFAEGVILIHIANQMP